VEVYEGYTRKPSLMGMDGDHYSRYCRGGTIGWQLKIAHEQLRVDFYLKLREEFDDAWLRVARRELAGHSLL